jgi:hypothetical protein
MALVLELGNRLGMIRHAHQLSVEETMPRTMTG